MLAGSGLVAQVVHFVPLLTDRGLSSPTAAAILSINSILAILTGFIAGVMIDRWGVRLVAPVLACLPAGASLILASGYGGLWAASLAAAMLGVFSGAIMPTMSLFVTRYFGVAHYGGIFAFLMAAFSMSQGAGAVVVGAIHDMAGGYRPALIAVAAAILAGAALTTLVGRPRPASSPAST